MKPAKNTILKIASVTLPTRYGIFQISIYQSSKDSLEHVVLQSGERLKKPTLVRIHSRCLTGDVFSSLKCDCRDQLEMSLKTIDQQGGILIYLNQEGRGIGLGSKIKAYFLQEKGYDTVEANKKLGFAADPRSYKIAAQVLKSLNVNQIVLITNNPDKVNQLESYGITVTGCIPLETTPNSINKSYLKTKKDKLGHKLRLV